MNQPFKPYPDYKPSGIEWLGNVPAHWEVLSNRAIFNEANEQNHPQEEMLSVTIADGVIRQQTLLKDSSKKDISRLDRSVYKLVRTGDIVYNKMRAWQGAVGVSKYEGIVSPAYVVQRPREKANSHYLHYLLRTPAFTTEAQRWSYGIASDMWSLRAKHFKAIYVCVPPLTEQTAIAAYLDDICGKIHRHIEAKERLVKLLEEYRRAIIHRTVTRGLDPNIPLKPSGIEWLGDVPKHWEVRRLCNSVAECVNGTWGTDPNGADDLPCIRVADFDREQKRVCVTTPTIRAITSSDRRRRLLRPGDLLLEKSGGGQQQPVGAVVLYDQEVDAVCSNFIARVVTKEGYNPNFLVFLHSALYAVGLNKRSIKQTTGIQNIDAKAYFGEYVAFPPLPEQAAIAAYLNKTTTDIDTAIHSTRREITLLREYRTRLIADVVTGKVDVREKK